MRSARAPVTEAFLYPYDAAWRQVREPSGDVAQVFSLVAGAALAVATLVLWLVFAPFKPIAIDYSALLVALFIVVVVHEIAHAVAFCCGTNKRERRVEVAWRKYRPHLRYDGSVTRSHYLIVLLAPYACVSLGTVAVAALVGVSAGDLVLISLVNALFSGADLVAALLVWEQVPSGAIVRRQGEAVLWRSTVRAAPA